MGRTPDRNTEPSPSYGRPRNYPNSEQYKQQEAARIQGLQDQTNETFGELAPFFDNGYYDPNSKTAAQDMRVALLRADWDDWVTRFLPIEQEIVASLGNPEVMNAEINRARSNVNRAFDRQNTQRAEFNRRYGIEQTPQVAQHNQRTSNIMRAAALSDSANDARRQVEDREMNILAGFGRGA